MGRLLSSLVAEACLMFADSTCKSSSCMRTVSCRDIAFKLQGPTHMDRIPNVWLIADLVKKRVNLYFWHREYIKLPLLAEAQRGEKRKKRSSGEVTAEHTGTFPAIPPSRYPVANLSVETLYYIYQRHIRIVSVSCPYHIRVVSASYPSTQYHLSSSTCTVTCQTLYSNFTCHRAYIGEY